MVRISTNSTDLGVENQSQFPQESRGQGHSGRGACGVFREQQRATIRKIPVIRWTVTMKRQEKA